MYESNNLRTHHIVDSSLHFWLQSAIDDSPSVSICLFRLRLVFLIQSYRIIKIWKHNSTNKTGETGEIRKEPLQRLWWQFLRHLRRYQTHKKCEIHTYHNTYHVHPDSGVTFYHQIQYLTQTRINPYIDSHRNTKCPTHKCTYICRLRPAGAGRQHARPLTLATLACPSRDLHLWKWWWRLLRWIHRNHDAIHSVNDCGGNWRRWKMIQSGLAQTLDKNAARRSRGFPGALIRAWIDISTRYYSLISRFPQKHFTIDLWYWWW